jgi:ElaB/YqjD/DUF883 family membrane-anchored ribosome-binding protein
MTRYETPIALRHDAHTLAQDTRALLEATAELTDQKVAEARERLNKALASGKQTYACLQEKADQSVQAADRVIRKHPYKSIAVVFGVGALLGYLISRRD